MGRVTRALAASCKSYDVRYTVGASCTYLLLCDISVHFIHDWTDPFSRKNILKLFLCFNPLSPFYYELLFLFLLNKRFTTHNNCMLRGGSKMALRLALRALLSPPLQ